MANASTKRLGARRRRRLCWVLPTGVVLGVIGTAAWIATPRPVGTHLLPSQWAEYGSTAPVEHENRSVTHGYAELHELPSPDSAEVISEAERRQASVPLGERYEARAVFAAPMLHLQREGDVRTIKVKVAEGAPVVEQPTDDEARPRPVVLTWD